MEFYVSALTDIGIKKEINQDCLTVKQLSTPTGNMVCAVLCDGMGGLTHGEIASKSIVRAFEGWIDNYLPTLSRKELYDGDIRRQWTDIIASQNEIIRLFGKQNNYRLGSTATVMLVTEKRYYILNIGDSRAYRINSSGVYRITTDHTVVEDEIERGNMTEMQAMSLPIRSVLTRCVGISKEAEPDMFFGDAEPDTVYMLCSDGFRHMISPEEMKASLYDGIKNSSVSLASRLERLIELNKQRGESDNISAAAIYTV